MISVCVYEMLHTVDFKIIHYLVFTCKMTRNLFFSLIHHNINFTTSLNVIVSNLPYFSKRRLLKFLTLQTFFFIKHQNFRDNRLSSVDIFKQYCVDYIIMVYCLQKGNRIKKITWGSETNLLLPWKQVSFPETIEEWMNPQQNPRKSAWQN